MPDPEPTPPPLSALSVAEARQALDDLVAALAPRARASAGTREFALPGPAGQLRARLYSPNPHTPLPVVLYLHGGGFVTCGIETHDAICHDLSHAAGCLVVSLEYRLAPEHKFPAASDDCLAALRWLGEHANDLNGDPHRIAIMGDSAGGNLAAVTGLRVRDEGGPALEAQVLVYPVTAYHTPATRSYLEEGEGHGLTRADMIWFWAHYLSDESQAGHPHAAPLNARNLTRLPPALVLTADHDPLRDEGEAYAVVLQACRRRGALPPLPGYGARFRRQPRPATRGLPSYRRSSRLAAPALVRAAAGRAGWQESGPPLTPNESG